MIEVLDPLLLVPGVRSAVLATEDGVPVAIRDRRSDAPHSGPEKRRDADWDEHSPGLEEYAESLAGLAIGWRCELSRSVAPLTWSAPRRLVLRASRGTLVVLHAPGAVLMCVLDRGGRPEDLRLPMEGAVSRMERILRSMGGQPAAAAPETTEGEATGNARGLSELMHPDPGSPDSESHSTTTSNPSSTPEAVGD